MCDIIKLLYFMVELLCYNRIFFSASFSIFASLSASAFPIGQINKLLQYTPFAFVVINNFKRENRYQIENLHVVEALRSRPGNDIIAHISAK